MANNEILKLTKSFALRIIRMAEFLFKNYPHNRVVNVSESEDAQSTNDFISKLSIALKEADETKIWIELLHESQYLSDDAFDSIYDDNEKIRAILIKIIKSLKTKKE